MFNRLLNKGGKWHKPASVDPKEWSKFDFDINWENLNKMYNLRKFYIEISPPFSRDSVPRVIEMEYLHDDITYYHVKKSWGRFIAWVIFTVFVLDFDDLEGFTNHPMVDNQAAFDLQRLNEGYLGDFN